MADKEKSPSPLGQALQEILNKMLVSGGLQFTADPELMEREIIEYDSRMRVTGLEKFNGPCFVSSVSFYKSDESMKNHEAEGALVVYLEQENADKVLKALGYAVSVNDDDDKFLDMTGEFCKSVAEKLQGSISSQGYSNFVVSEPIKALNDIAEGVEFPYSEYNLQEVAFHMFKTKSLVANITLTPP